MSDGLNIGSNWEQTKELLIYWHNEWAKEKIIKEFVLAYTNPKDTSFKEMIDSFRKLSKGRQEKIIALCGALKDVYGDVLITEDLNEQG